MRASLLTPNLNSSATPDVSFTEARKPSAPADASARSFKHVLTHARESAKPVFTKPKTEKAKTGKAGKAKPSNGPVITADQRKKADKTGSKNAQDGDTEDASADSPHDDASSQEDHSTQNSTGQDEATDAPGTASDESTITAAAHAAAAVASPSAAAAQHSTPKQQPSASDPATKTPTDAAKNSAASATVVQGLSQRPAKSKGGNGADPSAGKATTSDAKNAGTSIPDKMTTTPGLPTTVVEQALRKSEDAAASTTAVGTDPSSTLDSSDAIIDTPAAAPPSDPTPVETTSATDDSHPASATAAIDQSTFATIAQSLAGGPLAGASFTSGVSVTSTARAPAGTAANPQNAGVKFVADNHPNIVQSVKTQLLPTGGTMRLRLDPPELGAMQVSIHVKDGVVTASFETSNDQATKMLSHSLGQLKQALESQGIAVGKMHVQQSAKNESAQDRSTENDSDPDQSKENTSSSQQDEQRRETLRRMWERLSIGGDPLDLVA